MNRLIDYLGKCAMRCAEYFENYNIDDIQPAELKCAATEYFLRGGKRLRPAFLSLSAGAVGGRLREEAVTPAMVSVELFHTFTLVHDDIIDNDSTRRGGKSAHVLVSDMFSKFDRADEYGKDVAILAGDSLHAMSVKMLIECASSPLFSPKTVLGVVKLLEGECINRLLAGEANDTRMGLINDGSFDTGDINATMEMMAQKTGVLFSYSAKAGAMLGLDSPDPDAEEVRILGDFAMLCGIAFQLKDDILGITSDEKTLGKPIASDIREGKKTIILQESYKNANVRERHLIENTVGNRNASPEDIEEVKKIFCLRGGLDKAETLCSEYIKRGLTELHKLKQSEYRDLLEIASQFMSGRKM